MKTEHAELLERLEAWSPDASGAVFPFSQRLARENAWSLPYARRVIREYKRFGFLAVAAGHPVTPSDQVDQAWHLHLLYTESYWKEFCPDILRRPLHNGPTKGGAGERDKFNDWYARTLESYRAFFGEEPPSDIWPAPVQLCGGDIHFVRVNTARNWVVPKPAWMRKAAHVLSAAKRGITINSSWRLGTASLFLVMLLAGCTGDGDFRGGRSWLFNLTGGPFLIFFWPFNLTGGPFLIFFLITGTAAICCAGWLRRRARVPVEAPNAPLPELDTYEMAFLAGGKNRASFAAVTNLTHRGALEIDEVEHRLRRDVLPDSVNSFEASIHQSISSNYWGSTFKELADRAPVLLECERIEEKLKGLGLLTPDLQWWKVCFVPMLIALMVPAIGFTKIVIGVLRDKPVGILLVLSIISLVVALWFAVRPHRTRRGDDVLARLRDKYAHLERQPLFSQISPALFVLPLAVGLFGTSVLNGTNLAEMEMKLQANTGGSSGGGCGGGCGGGGGSCGGGGCGGGCGGCGG